MALATVRELTSRTGGADRPALVGRLAGDRSPARSSLLLGPSGCGKSTLLRALAGLVPHFHGGRFAGASRSAATTRGGRAGRARRNGGDALPGSGGPGRVRRRRWPRSPSGSRTSACAPGEIEPRARAALATVGAEHLAERDVAELSGGELQRVCLASALALEPALLLLDEPTSQLDPDAADAFFELVRRLARERGTAVVISEQRGPRRARRLRPRRLPRARRDRRRAARSAGQRRARLGAAPATRSSCRLDGVAFAYAAGARCSSGAALELRRGEIVALVGPNGTGKTTLAKLAAGLLEPDGGPSRVGRAPVPLAGPGPLPGRASVRRRGRARRRRRRARAARPCDRAVELDGYEARHPRDLSSGERERLGARRRARRPSPTSWFSTSRRAASTRGKCATRRTCFDGRRPAARRCSSRTTRSRRGRRRPQRRARERLERAACLDCDVRARWGGLAFAAAWTALAPEDAALSLLLVALALRPPASPGSSPGPARPRARADRRAGGHRRRRSCPLRRRAGRPAGHGDRGRRRRGARGACGDGGGRDGGARLQPLSRPGAVDAVADARLGAAAASPERCAPGDPGRVAVRTAMRRPRPRVQRAHGRLAVVQLLPAHVAGVHGRARARRAFDLAHAIGNLLIALVAGPELRRLLERYGRRLRPQVVWD